MGKQLASFPTATKILLSKRYLVLSSMLFAGDQYLLTFRASATAEGAYGELYLIGGVSEDETDTPTTVEIYNTEFKHWRDMSSKIPVARSGHCSVIRTDSIYLIGGEKLTSSQQHLTMDVYNITEGTWRQTHVFTDVDTRSGHGCVLFHDKIIVTGEYVSHRYATTIDKGPTKKYLKNRWTSRQRYGAKLSILHPRRITRRN